MEPSKGKAFCPSCLTPYQFSLANKGKKAKCKQCGQPFTIKFDSKPNPRHRDIESEHSPVTIAESDLVRGTQKQKVSNVAVIASSIGGGLVLLIFAYLVMRPSSKDVVNSPALPIDELSSALEPIETVELASANESPTLEFDGRSWTKHQEGRLRWEGGIDNYRFPNMESTLYVCDDPNLILTELTDFDNDDPVYDRTLKVMKRIGSGWVIHGKCEAWLDDGERCLDEYVDGNTEGQRTCWHANGNLKIYQNYVNGKKSGNAAGYYESGKLQWEAVYVNDVEVSGKSYREDGTDR